MNVRYHIGKCLWHISNALTHYLLIATKAYQKNRPFGMPLLCRKCVRQVYRTAYRDYRNRGVAGRGLLLAGTNVRVENQHTYLVLPLVKTEITYVIKGRINSLTWPSVWTISAEIPPTWHASETDISSPHQNPKIKRRSKVAIFRKVTLFFW